MSMFPNRVWHRTSNAWVSREPTASDNSRRARMEAWFDSKQREREARMAQFKKDNAHLYKKDNYQRTKEDYIRMREKTARLIAKRLGLF